MITVMLDADLPIRMTSTMISMTLMSILSLSKADMLVAIRHHRQSCLAVVESTVLELCLSPNFKIFLLIFQKKYFQKLPYEYMSGLGDERLL